VGRGAGGLTERYEALRVTRTCSRERALLMGCGLAAWMEAWSEAEGSVESPPPGDRVLAPPQPGAKPVELPPGVEPLVVQLLAGMTWAVLRS
jgi:hypothetical protein